jgi:uncharacterized protein (UPF0212 family)
MQYIVNLQSCRIEANSLDHAEDIAQEIINGILWPPIHLESVELAEDNDIVKEGDSNGK